MLRFGVNRDDVGRRRGEDRLTTDSFCFNTGIILEVRFGDPQAEPSVKGHSPSYG
jgi:hypothetical protein